MPEIEEEETRIMPRSMSRPRRENRSSKRSLIKKSNRHFSSSRSTRKGAMNNSGSRRMRSTSYKTSSVKKKRHLHAIQPSRANNTSRISTPGKAELKNDLSQSFIREHDMFQEEREKTKLESKCEKLKRALKEAKRELVTERQEKEELR